jgi:hypothetical protein
MLRSTDQYVETYAEEKTQLLKEHFDQYAALIKRDPPALNAKAPRSAFENLLNQIGHLLLAEAKRLAPTDGPVQDFLQEHPLPPAMSQRLPIDFRGLLPRNQHFEAMGGCRAVGD